MKNSNSFVRFLGWKLNDSEAIMCKWLNWCVAYQNNYSMAQQQFNRSEKDVTSWKIKIISKCPEKLL